MRDEVGVAADGAREVGVVLEAQPVVADVMGGVDGLRHRPDRRLLDDRRDGFPLHLLEQVVEVRAHDGALGVRKLVPERTHEVGERLDPLSVRLVVDAVGEGDLLHRRRRGDGPVGEQHELLDQAVRRLPLLLDHLDRVALGVEAHLDLGDVEVDGPLVHPLRRQRLGQPPRPQHLVGERVGLAVQDRLGAGVGEPMLRVDDRLADLPGVDVSRRRRRS